MCIQFQPRSAAMDPEPFALLQKTSGVQRYAIHSAGMLLRLVWEDYPHLHAACLLYLLPHLLPGFSLGYTIQRHSYTLRWKYRFEYGYGNRHRIIFRCGHLCKLAEQKQNHRIIRPEALPGKSRSCERNTA